MDEPWSVPMPGGRAPKVLSDLIRQSIWEFGCASLIFASSILEATVCTNEKVRPACASSSSSSVVLVRLLLLLLLLEVQPCLQSMFRTLADLLYRGV